MADDIIRLGPADQEELLTHLARCFREPLDRAFDRFLGGVYGPSEEKMARNFAIRRDGRIAAVVGLFPIPWRVGGTTIDIGGIGGVSVASEFRGQELMQRLMRHAVEQMRDAGTPLSFLSGHRQRYGYFGYEVAGHTLHFTVTADNLRHADALSRGVTAHIPRDEEFTAARDLHDSQPAYCARPPEDFVRFLEHWWVRPVALRRGDAFIGYAVVESPQTIHELVLTDAADAVDAVRAVMAFLHRDLVQVELPPTHPQLAREIDRVAAGVSLSASGNWQVFDWPRVLTALLRAKAQTSGLADGEAVLQVGGQALAMRVRGGQAVCEPTARAATLSLDAPAAMRLLFGPLPPTSLTPLPADAAALALWCPLPLSISRLDHV